MRAIVIALPILGFGCLASCTDEPAGGPETTTTRAPAGPPVDVEVEGPITGGERDLLYNAMPEGYEEQYGYREEEFFLSGTATSYTGDALLTEDGSWEASPADQADYKTRIIVREPEDPEDFNGLVVVEWNNVTVGRDSDPDFGFLHPELMRAGYGFVGVSAQHAGVEGGEGALIIPGVEPDAVVPLKEWDPERYGSLSHPGDAFSYDIFTQVGAVVQGRGEQPLFGDHPVDAIIAVGESQSAFRLTTYVNAVHPLVDTYDGFMIHSRGNSSAPLEEGDTGTPPSVVHIREDVDVPVLMVETETDLDFLGYLAARQPDSDHVMTWEVAGAAHADQAQIDYGVASGLRWSDTDFMGFTVCGRINAGPQAEVVRAALERLRAWVQDGTVPPVSPRLEVDGNGEIVRDDDGNALGGIRTPDVDAPVSALTGEGSPASVLCLLSGQEIPFTPERLAELYPTHADYVDAVTTAADEAVEAGFLLEADRDAFVEAAEESTVGS